MVELKSASGRYFRRVSVRTKEKVDIEGTLKPAFAIVSASGPAALNTDLRLTIEKQLQSAQSITLFAPSADLVTKFLGVEKLPPDWLAFDLNKRPIGTAADVATVMRADLSARLAKSFDAQGIASVTVPSNTNRNRLVVTLLAAGSAEPDVLDVSLDNAETVSLAVGRLDRSLSFFAVVIGLTVVDIADLEGPVVVGRAERPAAKAGIQPGDVVLKANAQLVGHEQPGALCSPAARRELTLELKRQSGRASGRMSGFMHAASHGMNDQSLMINRILVDSRARTVAGQIRSRLGCASSRVALARVGLTQARPSCSACGWPTPRRLERTVRHCWPGRGSIRLAPAEAAGAPPQPGAAHRRRAVGSGARGAADCRTSANARRALNCDSTFAESQSTQTFFQNAFHLCGLRAFRRPDAVRESCPFGRTRSVRSVRLSRHVSPVFFESPESAPTQTRQSPPAHHHDSQRQPGCAAQ